MKRVAIRRKPKADPVTADLYVAVVTRDLRFAGGCVAAHLDSTHGCRDSWGTPYPPESVPLQLDHVQSGYGRMGKRADSSMATLVSICPHGHLNGWATANRPALRWYLDRANAA